MLRYTVAAVFLIAIFIWEYRGERRDGWKPTFSPNKNLDIKGSHGAVASDSHECSELGVRILRNGGSAADAAVTVALCIGITHPQSSGIGGGGFVTLRMPDGNATIIDARETAPASAHKHMFSEDPILSKWGGKASGVPGEIAGLWELWKEAGKLPWHDLVHPVARLSRDYAVDTAVREAAEWFKENGEPEADINDWDWLWSSLEHGRGHRPQLARTLDLIAEHGADIFYDPTGPIAPSLVRTLNAAGGEFTLKDFESYSVVLREPIHFKWLGRDVFTAPAPSSGPALAMGLQAIEQVFGSDPLGEVEVHRIVEVMKWMAAARSHLGDPAYSDNDATHLIPTPEWASWVVGNISDNHTLPSWRDYHPAYEMNEPEGTAHFSVVDADGMAVAMTTTVNLPFGNLICDPVTGVILNSEMDDFSNPDSDNWFNLAPSIYNFIEPGKRPLSSTCPTVIMGPDDLPELVIGAAGGSRILTAVFEAVTRIYGYNVSLLDAIAWPRVHHQLLPEVASVEFETLKSVTAGLEKRGHKIEYVQPRTAMNGIHRKDEILHAVSDFWRKGGIGAAY